MQLLRLRLAKSKPGAFARQCTCPTLHRLLHLAVELIGASDEPISGDEYRSALGVLEQPQSLRVESVWRVSMYGRLRHVALICTLRSSPSAASPAVHSPLTAPSRHTRAKLICNSLINALQLQLRLQLARTLIE